MSRRRGASGIYWFTIVSFLIAIVLLTIQLIVFSRSRVTYPNGLVIGGISVGNLNRQATVERLLSIYSLPVELHYNDQVILMNPGSIGFELNLESMLSAADLARTGGPFWTEFWGFLFGEQTNPDPIPLDATYSETLLRDYLTNEVASRYDEPAVPAQPLPGTIGYNPGTPGTEIDMDSAVIQIENALLSSTNRIVTLPIGRSAPPRPSMNNLEIFIKQTIDLANYDGIAGIYLLDLQTANEMHFIYENGSDIPDNPDVAFSASSIIKIPIMVSAYRRLDNQDPPEEAVRLLTGMMEESGNDPADWLMQGYIDQERGPLVVTDDMRALGLENTFLGGYFRIGSPLLRLHTTPANSRTDVNTDPDIYSQTTLSDIGMLLSDIYQCEQLGGGALVAVFPQEITQDECREMVDTMTRNYVPFLIVAGAPEGTRIAHKHGWVTDTTGAIRTIGDAGIVYTPSGNYVLVIYFYHPVQLIWEPVSDLIRNISESIYNYFNLPSQ